MKIHNNKVLQKIMIDKNIVSTEDLARHTGVSANFARYALEKKHDIQIQKAIVMAKALDTTVEKLFGEEVQDDAV